MVSFDMIIDIKFNSVLQKLFEKPFPMFLKQILGAWYDWFVRGWMVRKIGKVVENYAKL